MSKAPFTSTLYPTMESEQEVKDYLLSQLPITSPNELHAALMTYRNTLLQQGHDHEHRKDSQ